MAGVSVRPEGHDFHLMVSSIYEYCGASLVCRKNDYRIILLVLIYRTGLDVGEFTWGEFHF